MSSLETFKIDLNGLGDGVTTFEYGLDDSYFEAMGGSDIRGGRVGARLDVTRSGLSFSLEFSVSGTVTVACDLCLDDMEQPVSASGTVVAKLGDGDMEGDDYVVVDRNDGILDVAWLIYEFVALAVPVRHVHGQGGCNPGMLDILKAHTAARDGVSGDTGVADSRWSELEKLKTIFKD